MNTSHWPRTRTPPSRPSAGFDRRRNTQRRALAGPARAEAPSESPEHERRGDRHGEVGRRDDPIVGPERPQQSVGVMDRGRLLIPRMAIRQLAVQDALADVGVKRLIGAGGLGQ